jgi:translation initiation factor IF-3
LIETRINDGITATTVRVVDNTGKFLGILSIKEAIALASNDSLDLIEVSPNSTPPVCKIMSYDKYRFSMEQQEKLAKKNQKVVELKEIKVKLNIADNDLNTKMKQITKFLAEGDKVKITIPMKGRELSHKDLGFALIDKIMLNFNEHIVEKSPSINGKTIYSIITPKK